jgi:fumarylacetoacetase
MVTHHASNGCPLRPGDLLATGTVSGPGQDMRASLLELTERGRNPVGLPEGGERVFLADGDEIILTAWCRRLGAVTIGFGACAGVVESAG